MYMIYTRIFTIYPEKNMDIPKMTPSLIQFAGLWAEGPCPLCEPGLGCANLRFLLNQFLVQKNSQKWIQEKKHIQIYSILKQFHDVSYQTLGCSPLKVRLFLDLFRTQDRNPIVATEVAKNAKSSKSGSSSRD